MTADWRDDPLWALIWFEEGTFPGAPPDRPTKDAELAQPDVWASLYAGSRVVATWCRLP